MARITVINDYPDFLETMYAILDGDLGHQVAGFDGDSTSLDDIVTSKPELLVVDLRLGQGDAKGWEILLLCRGDDTLRDVPMIVCSADVTTLRERADEFARMRVLTLEKPFDLDTVTEVVERALRGAGPGARTAQESEPRSEDVA